MLWGRTWRWNKKLSGNLYKIILKSRASGGINTTALHEAVDKNNIIYGGNNHD
jgi:hypothetical protein